MQLQRKITAAAAKKELVRSVQIIDASITGAINAFWPEIISKYKQQQKMQ